jgi:hypothetical protein
MIKGSDTCMYLCYNYFFLIEIELYLTTFFISASKIILEGYPVTIRTGAYYCLCKIHIYFKQGTPKLVKGN